MPRRLAACLALLVGASPALAEGRRAAGDFHRTAEIAFASAPTPGQAYGVPLSAAASAALTQGGELRLFDADGREIPSLVHSASARAEMTEREVSLFDRAWTPGLEQTLTVELVERAPQSVNEFAFDIADEDYNATVQVEGRDESGTWRIVAEGLHLIRHTIPGEQIRFVHDSLRIPTSRYRIYRFTLRESGREEPLAIEKVAVREVIRRGQNLHLNVRLGAWRNPRDEDARHQYWTLDLERAYLGVDLVQLSIEGDDYARPATLWAWNPELQRPGPYLASTVLFRYGDDASTGFEGFATDAERLVMMIDQGDDEPIAVTRARASRPRQQVRFLVDGDVSLPLALYLRPDEPREPKYDLPRRLAEYGIASFETLEHGPLRDNPAYRPPPTPLSERTPLVLYTVVGAAVAGLAIYLVRALRQGLPG